MSRHSARTVYRLFVFVACLNLIDAACTFYFLANGIVEEANPIMRAAWEYSPGLFLGVKLVASFLCIIIGICLTKLESVHRIVRIISISAVVVYGVIIGLHAYVFITKI